MKKNIYIIGVLVAFTFGLIMLRAEPAPVPSAAATSATQVAAAASSSPAVSRMQSATSLPTTRRSQTVGTGATLSTPSPDITISVGATNYAVYVPPDSTVLDAMRIVASTTSFTFTGRDYPSLGYFIESIDGKKNADGYYWFLYINGRSSDTGVSQTTLKPGDIVEWRYENNY